MISKPSLTADKYAVIDELVRLGSIAVDDAQNDSRRLGVPNVYSINGRLYYETSTGELSATDPYAETTEPCDEPKTRN
ncbi:MAG: hypothetical protein AAFP90_22465 [Planctomycetota bacterium]